MNCAHAEERLNAFMDNELDVNDALELGMHLAGCRPCRELRQDLERLDSIASALPRHPAEGTVTEAVLLQLNSEAIGHEASTGSRQVIRAPDRKRPRGSWAAAIGRSPLRSILVASTTAALLVLTVYLGGMLSGPRNQTHANMVHNDPPAQTPSHGKPDGNARQTSTVGQPQDAHDTRVDPPFDGNELLNALYAQEHLIRKRRFKALPIEERERIRAMERIKRELSRPGEAAGAAHELASMKKDPNGEIPFLLATAVTDRLTGSEVFEALSSLEPSLRLAPMYIAALGQRPLKKKAHGLLCKVSGKRYGPHRSKWLQWWALAQAKGHRSAQPREDG